MHARGVADRLLGLVRDQDLAVGLDEVGDANAFREAAALGEVGLEDVNFRALDEVAELPEGVFVLPRGHRHVQGGADLGVALVIVLGEGLLVVDDVQLVLELATHADGGAHGVAVVAVEVEVDLVAYFAPHRAQQLQVLGGVHVHGARAPVHAHLEGGEALAHALHRLADPVRHRVLPALADARVETDAILPPAAQELPDGQPRHFTGDVPERDVDARDGFRLGAHDPELVGGVEHLVPESPGVQRVLAEDDRDERVLEHRGDDLPVHGAALAEAGDSLVRADEDEHRVGLQREDIHSGDLQRPKGRGGAQEGGVGQAQQPPREARDSEPQELASIRGARHRWLLVLRLQCGPDRLHSRTTSETA